MKCPFCGHTSSKVLDSRASDAGIRRRRVCEECGERFTTYEQVQRTMTMVVKKDGRREEFQREKLLNGLRVAARKRPLPTGAIEAIVDDIERQLMAAGRPEVPSRVIGEMAITRLKPLDAIAYIRFASVYHQFVSLEQMLEELQRIALSPVAPAPEQAPLFDDDYTDILGLRASRSSSAGDDLDSTPADLDLPGPDGGAPSLDPGPDEQPAAETHETDPGDNRPISISSIRSFLPV